MEREKQRKADSMKMSLLLHEKQAGTSGNNQNAMKKQNYSKLNTLDEGLCMSLDHGKKKRKNKNSQGNVP